MLSLRRQNVVPIDPDASAEALRAGASFGQIHGALGQPYPAAVASRRKRALDVLLACLILAIGSPVVLGIALAIRLTSPGPILFRQRRVGLDGAPFTVLKFRTMQDGASHEIHERFVSRMLSATPPSLERGAYKLQRDPRVTAVGRWLRKTSLDELPQLVNVLKGEMSIVGPRPPLAYEVVKYEAWQRERLAVRPGLTGLWQVSGRNRLTYVEMCRVDVAYVRGWSFLQDLKIVARTPWVMFVNRGGAE
jgi:lipopolysaccharide/colanic/teichoic acid biosynthesis glycosyltransferase